MQVTNIHDRALLIAATGVTVEPGASVDVDDGLGESLVAQVDRWSTDKPKPKPTSKSKADSADKPKPKPTSKSKADSADKSEEDA